MTSTIITKNSSTASGVPLAADLTAGELAINLADKRLFSKNGSTVFEVGTTPSTLAVTGAATVGGTLGVTGATTLAATSATTLSASSTVTLSGGTANGVAYLNGSKVLTTGTALTFDGSQFKTSVSGSTPIVNETTGGTSNYLQLKNTGGSAYIGSVNNDLAFYYSGSATEGMRLTSTGLGIGTSSPASKLDVKGRVTLSGVGTSEVYTSDTSGLYLTAATSGGMYIAANGNFIFRQATTPYTEWMRIDTSGNVGIGTSSPSASAILDAQSTTKGVRMPNMTTTQKNAIASPAAGLMVFDTTLAKLCVYSGSAWQTITSI